MKTDRTAELELVLTGTLHGRARLSVDGRTRDFSDTYRATITAFASTKIEYGLGWMMAYGMYARARFTDNINILALPDSRTAIKKVFGDIGFQLIRDAAEHLSFDDPASGVAIRIEFDDAEPVYSAVKNPAHFQIFDTDTRVITPEYLMWMLCESGLLKHRANAVDLYLAGHVDVAKLSHLLERAGRADLLAKVREIMASAERVKFSSYDASMVARMARMKRE